ncbi:MAG: hypothetical protein MJE77_27845, partial [Proteobacteria bacterium]|nr:hypothetical protein [Pseudomonadota bacterium]
CSLDSSGPARTPEGPCQDPAVIGPVKKCPGLQSQDHRPDRLTLARWAPADRRERRGVIVGLFEMDSALGEVI